MSLKACGVWHEHVWGAGSSWRGLSVLGVADSAWKGLRADSFKEFGGADFSWRGAPVDSVWKGLLMRGVDPSWRGLSVKGFCTDGVPEGAVCQVSQGADPSNCDPSGQNSSVHNPSEQNIPGTAGSVSIITLGTYNERTN